MTSIKKLLVLSSFIISGALFADSGFGGAFAGGLTGGIIGNAFAPRQKETVIIESSHTGKRKRSHDYDDLSSNCKKMIDLFEQLTEDEQIAMIKEARRKINAQ